MRVLNLGCGREPLPDAVNHDRERYYDHIDVAHDLDLLPWPWADASFDRIVAIDVLEHLRGEVDGWLNECHRILVPGGVLVIRVPHYQHENAYTDPTHRRFFTPRTFDYWDKSRELHQKYGCFYYERESRWWRIEANQTDNANICFVMTRQ